MITKMINAYGASKLRSAPLWRELDKLPYVTFRMRWLKHTTIGTEDSAENAVIFWEENIADVLMSDIVVVYAEEWDPNLRGALVEAGIAIGNGIPVVVVGDSHAYGTWRYCPEVYSVADIEDLKEFLLDMSKFNS